MFDSMDLRVAVRDVYVTAHNGGYRYGDSHTLPPCNDRIISCDRLIARALWNLGYTDQPGKPGTTCGMTVTNMDGYLIAKGWRKVLKTMYLTHGDVALFAPGTSTPPQSTAKNAAWHTFLIDQYYNKNKIWKYDTGSQERIRQSQPFVNVPLNEWPASRSFYAAYRCPLPDAGIKTGDYIIHSSINDDYVIDVSDGSTEARANIQLYKKNGTAAQVFHIDSLGGGLYKITNKQSGMVFDVAGGSVEPDANVQQYKDNGTDAQRFFIQDTPDGFVELINRKGGLVLDVDQGIAAKRQNIKMSGANDNPSEKWRLEKI